MDCNNGRGTFGEEPDGWMSFEQVVRDYRRNLARLFAEGTRPTPPAKTAQGATEPAKGDGTIASGSEAKG